MRNLVIILLSVVLLSACESRQQKALTMRDLKFPDPEKEAIVRNHISGICGFDTSAESLKMLPTMYTHEHNMQNIPLDSMYMISLGGFKYDSLGNKIFDRENEGAFHMCGPYHNVEFDFDSLGMITRGHRYSSDTFGYTLLSGNTLLTNHIIRSNGGRSIPDGFDTEKTYSCFDSTGKILFSLKYLYGSFSNADTTTYSYSTDGKLFCKKEGRHVPTNNTIPDFIKNIVTRYCYKGNLLDSVTTTYDYFDTGYKHTDVCYYNKDGLRYAAVKYPRFRNYNTRNLALHVYYRYKKFGEADKQ